VPTVEELRTLSNIRDKAIAENAATIAEGILRAIYGTVDELGEKLVFHPEVQENDLEGVVRLGLKLAVLSRIESSITDAVAMARADAKEAWWRRTPTS
jgi:hypothetical protein